MAGSRGPHGMAGAGREEGRAAAGARREEGRAAAARLAVEGRRREVDMTCGPYMSGSRLARVIVIWTSREPINNFRDSELYFLEFEDRDDTEKQI